MLGLQIDHAQEDGTVVFQDGSSIKADVIMHCTGYSDLQYHLHPVSYKSMPFCVNLESDNVLLAFVCCLATCMTFHSLEMTALSPWTTTVSIHYTSIFFHPKWHLICPSSDCLGKSVLLQIDAPVKMHL
jgi:hypothetical protein